MTMKYLMESFLCDRSTRSAKFPHQRAQMVLALLILTREQYKSLCSVQVKFIGTMNAWEKKKRAFQKLCLERGYLFPFFFNVRPKVHTNGEQEFSGPSPYPLTCRVVCPEGKSGLWTLTASFTVATDPGRFSPVFCSTRTHPPTFHPPAHR